MNNGHHTSKERAMDDMSQTAGDSERIDMADGAVGVGGTINLADPPRPVRWETPDAPMVVYYDMVTTVPTAVIPAEMVTEESLIELQDAIRADAAWLWSPMAPRSPAVPNRVAELEAQLAAHRAATVALNDRVGELNADLAAALSARDSYQRQADYWLAAYKRLRADTRARSTTFVEPTPREADDDAVRRAIGRRAGAFGLIAGAP